MILVVIQPMRMHDPMNALVHNPVTKEILCREHWLDLSGGSLVMGILNVTPDSFYDGGKYETIPQALHRVEEMLSDGARIIDVGGASSRPSGQIYGAGAVPVSETEEIRRVVPIVSAIKDAFPQAIISVDTFSAEVVKVALEAGAHMINDISGLQNGIISAKYAAEVNAAYVVMHSVGYGDKLIHTTEYEDVVDHVCRMLDIAAKKAKKAGINSVVIDPGFGFGKQHHDNLQLIQHIDMIAKLSYPILVGISRKSTVGRVLGTDQVLAPIDDRLYGSLGITAVAVHRGANIIRTHDIRETVEMIQGMEAVLNL